MDKSPRLSFTGPNSLARRRSPTPENISRFSPRNSPTDFEPTTLAGDRSWTPTESSNSRVSLTSLMRTDTPPLSRASSDKSSSQRESLDAVGGGTTDEGDTESDNEFTIRVAKILGVLETDDESSSDDTVPAPKVERTTKSASQLFGVRSGVATASIRDATDQSTSTATSPSALRSTLKNSHYEDPLEPCWDIYEDGGDSTHPPPSFYLPRQSSNRTKSLRVESGVRNASPSPFNIARSRSERLPPFQNTPFQTPVFQVYHSQTGDLTDSSRLPRPSSPAFKKFSRLRSPETPFLTPKSSSSSLYSTGSTVETKVSKTATETSRPCDRVGQDDANGSTSSDFVSQACDGYYSYLARRKRPGVTKATSTNKTRIKIDSWISNGTSDGAQPGDGSAWWVSARPRVRHIQSAEEDRILAERLQREESVLSPAEMEEDRKLAERLQNEEFPMSPAEMEQDRKLAERLQNEESTLNAAEMEEDLRLAVRLQNEQPLVLSPEAEEDRNLAEQLQREEFSEIQEYLRPVDTPSKLFGAEDETEEELRQAKLAEIAKKDEDLVKRLDEELERRDKLRTERRRRRGIFRRSVLAMDGGAGLIDEADEIEGILSQLRADKPKEGEVAEPRGFFKMFKSKGRKIEKGLDEVELEKRRNIQRRIGEIGVPIVVRKYNRLTGSLTTVGIEHLTPKTLDGLKEINETFSRDIGKRVKKLEWILNEHLRDQFHATQASLRKAGRPTTDMILFHGTRKSNIDR
jgi:hypothetical protein